MWWWLAGSLLIAGALSLVGCDEHGRGVNGLSSGIPSDVDRPGPEPSTVDDTVRSSVPPAASVDCRDGDCVVRVTVGTVIEFDSSVPGVASLSVSSVDHGLVRLESRYRGGGGGFIAATVGGVSAVNGLAVEVVDVDDTGAVLDIETR